MQWSFCNPSCLNFHLAILTFQAVRIILGWVITEIISFSQLRRGSHLKGDQMWVAIQIAFHYPHHQLVQPNRQVLMVEPIVNVSFHLETTLLDLVVQPS